MPLSAHARALMFSIAEDALAEFGSEVAHRKLMEHAAQLEWQDDEFRQTHPAWVTDKLRVVDYRAEYERALSAAVRAKAN